MLSYLFFGERTPKNNVVLNEKYNEQNNYNSARRKE